MKFNAIMQKIFLLSILALSSTSHAATPVPYGWYLEANGGLANTHAQRTPGKEQSNSWGGNVNLGYKFTPFTAAEFGYSYYGKASIKTQGTTVARNQQYAYDLAAKMILPVPALDVSLFAKAGLSQMYSRLTVTNQAFANANGLTFNPGRHSSSGVYYGAGADYSISPNLATSVQWQRAKSNNRGNLDLYSLGLTFIF